MQIPPGKAQIDTNLVTNIIQVTVLLESIDLLPILCCFVVIFYSESHPGHIFTRMLLIKTVTVIAPACLHDGIAYRYIIVQCKIVTCNFIKHCWRFNDFK